MLIVDLVCVLAPPFGVDLVTWPAVYLSLCSLLICPISRWFCFNKLTASAFDIPLTSGTVITRGVCNTAKIATQITTTTKTIDPIIISFRRKLPRWAVRNPNAGAG